MTQLKQHAENYSVTKMEEQVCHAEFWKDVSDDEITSVCNNKCSYSNFCRSLRADTWVRSKQG